MKQWLYRIQPSRAAMLIEGPSPEEERLVGQHFAYLKDLTGKGIVLLAGRTLNTDSSSFGIVIYKAADEKEARRIFENDPAVKAGVFVGEIYPYSVALVGDF
ncbi:MAG: YciI family protein [Thermoplasmata archaeon]